MDSFFDHLQREINRIFQRNVLIVMGDFNAKVGNDASLGGGAIGNFGFGDINDRGEQLIHFCNANGLCYKL